MSSPEGGKRCVHLSRSPAWVCGWWWGLSCPSIRAAAGSRMSREPRRPTAGSTPSPWPTRRSPPCRRRSTPARRRTSAWPPTLRTARPPTAPPTPSRRRRRPRTPGGGFAPRRTATASFEGSGRRRPSWTRRATSSLSGSWWTARPRWRARLSAICAP